MKNFLSIIYNMPPKKRNYKTKPKLAKRTIATIRKTVKSVLKTTVEDKYKSTYGTNNAIDVTGIVSNALTAPSQGVADTERIGDKINITSISFRFSITAADGTNLIRLLIFQWHEDDNVSVPVISDILTDPTSGALSPVYYHYNHDTIGHKFTVLYDKVYNLSGDDVGGENQQVYKSMYIPRKYMKRSVKFTGGSIKGMNHVRFLCVSDSGSVSHPSMDWIARAHYTDA